MNDPVTFPCSAIPSHAPHARLLGIYPQRQEGLYLQRVRVPMGQPTAAQWRALAEIARKFTPHTPLHLTTRQDVELHDLTAQNLPLAQDALTEAGLSGFASAGDTARNITVCSCTGSRCGRVDLAPLAKTIAHELAGIEGIYSLPRKFKISLSACPKACALPYINDVGLVAQADGRFLAIVAGSLGAKPATGTVLRENMSADAVLPLVHAAVKFFSVHGDREHRNTARLRHIRERMGDQAFLAALGEELARQRASRDWPEIVLATTGGTLAAKVNLTFPNGDVTPEAADALAELADDPSMTVRIGLYHQVAVFDQNEPAIRTRIEQAQPLCGPGKPQAIVVACPGNRWCSRGLVDAQGLADRIRAELGARMRPEQTVCVSGCPNGCAHSAVADIGLTGGRMTVDGKSVDAFKLSCGGGKGRNATLARQVADKLTPDRAMEQVANALP